jgi:hypothetical protein
MKALHIISTISAESILILVESIWIQLEIVSWFISFIWLVGYLTQRNQIYKID